MLSTRRCAQLGVVAAFAVLAASVSALVLVPRYSRPVQVADVGTAAPNFELPAVDGSTFNLGDHRGQAVVLFFSSLQSPDSNLYDERVDRLARSYADDERVKFFAINVGSGEHADPYFLKRDPRITARSYPTLLDDKASIASRYSATTTPTMVVIDPRGMVCYHGPFDNNVDLAFASHSFLADALHGVLDRATVTVASK